MLPRRHDGTTGGRGVFFLGSERLRLTRPAPGRCHSGVGGAESAEVGSGPMPYGVGDKPPRRFFGFRSEK